MILEVTNTLTHEAAGRPRSYVTCLLLTATFLTVVGARFWLVQQYSLAMPFWDQWGAEGMKLIKPWVEHRLQLASLFAAHNEHRIFLTRLIALGLFIVNGQWDALVEMTFNAILCGVIASMMAFQFTASLGPRWRWTAALAMTLLFALPFSWENILAGFQNQFYLLLILSLTTLLGLGTNPPFSANWWLGAVCAAAACGTMATGFTAAGIVLGWDVYWSWRRRVSPTLGNYVTWAWCLVIVIFGFLTRTVLPGSEWLRAESVSVFILALGKALAWPFCDHPLLAFAMYLPLGLLVTAYLTQPEHEATSRRKAVETVLIIAPWVMLQAAAMAYARGVHATAPASRYMDLLALGATLNFFALLLLLSRYDYLSGMRRANVGAAMAWICLLFVGLAGLTQLNFARDMPTWRKNLKQEERSVRAYIATGDFEHYLAHKTGLELPYPEVDELAKMLDDRTIRSILPEDIRLPLPIQRVDDASLDPGFVPGGFYPVTGPSSLPAMTWGSYDASGDAGQGRFLGRIEKPSDLRYLKFEIAGYLSEADLSFVLRDSTTSRDLDYHPSEVARERWHAEYVPASGHRYQVIAIDSSPKRWFAFSGAVEVGSLSYWSGYARRRGPLIFCAGALLFTLLATYEWLTVVTQSVE